MSKKMTAITAPSSLPSKATGERAYGTGKWPTLTVHIAKQTPRAWSRLILLHKVLL